jgi:hypothetical protein
MACVWPIIAAGRISEDRQVLAAEQPVYRQAGGLAFDVPQRDVDARDRRHDLNALAARHRRRQPVVPRDPTGTRRGERKQLCASASMPRMISPKRLTHSQMRGIGAAWISP